MSATAKGRKLGRKTPHKLSMLSNLVMSLFEHEQIKTTVTRAKEASRLADKLITLARKDSLHARREAAKVLSRQDIIQKLFEDIAKRNADRPSGHTRLLRLPARKGDGSVMGLLQLVDSSVLSDDVEGDVVEEAVEVAEATSADK